jgi:hypothetical protein
MSWYVRVIWALAVSAIALAAAGEDVRLLPSFRYGTISDGVGQANLVPYDLDGDGKAELISCSNGAPFAVSARGGTYVTTWHGPAGSCTSIAAGDRDLDGGADIIVAADQKLSVFDPRSLGGPAVTIALPDYAVDVAIGNVDDDPAPEIVVLGLAATLVYDGATLELQWTATGYGGYSVQIGDVDGDARREIVVTGPTGYVLDGAAEVQKWGYAGGFPAFTVGNVDGDAKDEIVFRASGNSAFTILNGDTFTTTTHAVDWYFDTLAVADANGDGLNEVITGNNQWGDIEGHSPVNGALLWSIYNPEHGTMAVGAADLDGDQTLEVFWGAGATSSGDDALFIGRASTVQYLWRCLDLDGQYFSAARDLDGDGRVEYVVATRASSSGYEGGIIEIFDAATRLSIGRLFTDDSWEYGISAIGIGQLDADPALEIAALVNGVLTTWDGSTHLQEFSNSGGMSLVGSGDALLIANLDADAVDEIVVAAGEQVLVLNGASNFIQKSLVTGAPIVDFSAADLNGDSRRELVVATSSGLTVYDTASWGVLGSVAVASIHDTDATAAGGGTVAVSFHSYGDPAVPLQLYKGAALTPAFSCTTPWAAKLVVGDIGNGEMRLLTSSDDGIRVYPLDADTCPQSTPVFETSTIHSLKLADVTNDGRNELLIDSEYASAIALLGLSSELRGDVDGDQVITADDVETAVDQLFGAAPGTSPAADANADGRVSVEDAFVLIDHQFAGGAALQP